VILIVARLTVRPEHADSWPDHISDFTAATRAEPGNLFFEWYRGLDDPQVFVLLEGFLDNTLEAHNSSPHFKKFTAELPRALAAAPQLITTTALGEGWSLMTELKPG
jgi:quinol monooxygenase YgiN